MDQFEETFTLAREEAAPFQAALAQLIGRDGLYILLTVRSDFYSELFASPLWPMIQAHRLELTPLDAAGLRAAIISPADKVKVYVEAALVERLVADAAGEPGVLPLMQETLVLLWEHLERRFLGLGAYEMLRLTRLSYGEEPRTALQVALARHANHALSLLPQEDQPLARRLFLRLVFFLERSAPPRGVSSRSRRY